jgi:gluconolactonase
MYFAPPEKVSTSVFTRLPDRFRRPRRSAWADSNRGGMEIDSFLEGPAFDRAGRLYVADIPFGRIFRVSPQGDWELVTEYDGWPNGLAIHRDGRIFIADYKCGILALDPDSATITTILADAGSEGFKGVNDLVFAPNGDLYFTDQGQTGLQDATGRVYRLTADGRLDRLLATVPSPNGVAIDDKAANLFVAVTRAQQVWRIPLNSSGIVAKVGVFAQLHGGLGGPDGLALDAEGGLLVAQTGFGSVWRLSRLAEPLQRIVTCAGISTTNIAFGGDDGRTLYVTESQSGSVLSTRLATGGQVMYSHS